MMCPQEQGFQNRDIYSGISRRRSGLTLHLPVFQFAFTRAPMPPNYFVVFRFHVVDFNLVVIAHQSKHKLISNSTALYRPPSRAKVQ